MDTAVLAVIIAGLWLCVCEGIAVRWRQRGRGRRTLPRTMEYGTGAVLVVVILLVVVNQ